MSYTLNVEPDIVRDAESYALRSGTTLDAMIRACMLVIVSRGVMEGDKTDSKFFTGSPVKSGLKIGLMADEISLPERFDEDFDSLDDKVASMFAGAAS